MSTPASPLDRIKDGKPIDTIKQAEWEARLKAARKVYEYYLEASRTRRVKEAAEVEYMANNVRLR